MFGSEAELSQATDLKCQEKAANYCFMCAKERAGGIWFPCAKITWPASGLLNLDLSGWIGSAKICYSVSRSKIAWASPVPRRLAL